MDKNRKMTRIGWDRDKNGLIDPVEQARTRWTNPSASESDTNKDKNLSRLELAYRYKKREDDALKRSRAKTAARSKVVKPGSKLVSTTNNRYRSSTSRTRRSPSSSRSTNSSRSSKKGFNSGNDAYRRYAEGLLKNYDKDKDGRLSKKELEEMRRPPKNADTNKDGYVDKSELVASVTRKSGSTGSSSASSKVLDNKRRSSNKSYNDKDSIFGGKDLNNDRQLQMKEFAEDWTDELVEEFKEKDLNGDGVITESEWNGKR